MAFGIGNVSAGAGGGLMVSDADFGTGRDGALNIEPGQTIILPVTVETGIIDKHYTDGYIDVTGVLKPQNRHMCSILRFQGDLTVRGTMSWEGSGSLADSTYPFLHVIDGDYDYGFMKTSILRYLNIQTIRGGEGGTGGSGQTVGYAGGGAGSRGAKGHSFGGGAGGNGGGGGRHVSTSNYTSGSAGVAPSDDRQISSSYGAGGSCPSGAGGGVGPGAGGGGNSAGYAGSAYPGGALILLVAGKLILTPSGLIKSNGLDGSAGGPAGSYHGAGGGGGGGGGGVIMIFYGDTYANAGTINVNGGLGAAAGSVGTIIVRKAA